MKFNNRQNRCITSEDGEEIWISRSVAVTACMLAVFNKIPYVLINQRGPGVPNQQFFWNLVCGYLDFDENLEEAAVRECWEECGVNALELMKTTDYVFFNPPWDISSKPGKSEKQNITVHHGLITEVDALPEVSDAHNEPGETVDIRWLPLGELASLEFAFDHDERIRKFVDHVSQHTSYDFRGLVGISSS